jgi:hypothetical protein
VQGVADLAQHDRLGAPENHAPGGLLQLPEELLGLQVEVLLAGPGPQAHPRLGTADRGELNEARQQLAEPGRGILRGERLTDRAPPGAVGAGERDQRP